jgi:spore germination protein GerM
MPISVDTLTSGYLATNIIASVIMVFLTFGLLVPVKRIMKRVDNWLEKLNVNLQDILSRNMLQCRMQ